MTVIIKPDLSWVNFKEKDIKNIKKEIEILLKNYKQKLLKLKDSEYNFSNCVHLGEVLSADIHYKSGILWSFINLSTNEKLQATARDIELQIGRILREFAYDQELYQVFVKYFNTNYQLELKDKKLTQEEIKIVEDSNKSYKKMGMHLDKKTKKIPLHQNPMLFVQLVI